MASSDAGTLVPIPQPPTHLYGFLGNVPDLDPSFTLKSFWRLHALYGPIVELDLLSRKIIVVSNYELIHEVCDDDRFEKLIGGSLVQLRPLIKDGLFTAYNHEPNWHRAHRTLMPVFGPLSVRKMFKEQLDIASQMVLKWDRLGPDHVIDTADDFTRLAFDTIGICAFNFRFNNFYSERMHSFANQMAESLIEAGKRAIRTGLETSMRIWSAQHFQDNVQKMHQLCDSIIAERKAHPQPEINDLLNIMLNVVDPVSGEKLDDENIRYQMATFLIAGHETTSGTLAYLFYNLLKNPETLHQAQKEVDEVVGDGPLDVNHLAKLKYIDACIKETLRLNGPIGAFGRKAKQDTVIGGKYKIPADVGITVNLYGLHKDPKVWGDDAGVFKPERMFDFQKLPPDSWKPFGTGIRACIGRAFAEQEMILNVALILQRFQVEMANPAYELELKSTLTTKPEGFSIKVRRRLGRDIMVGLAGTGASPAVAAKGAASQTAKVTGGAKGRLLIAYGSNAGTCRAFAEDLQTNAPEFGFEADVVPLDQITETLVKEKPTVIITSSYEGKPPDNAKKFVSWLEAKQDSKHLDGIQYALFGVGNSEWSSTYHKVPRAIGSMMDQNGATALCNPAFADVKSDCVGEWEAWSEQFWAALGECGLGGAREQKSELSAQIFKHDVPALLGGKEMSYGIVKSTRSLGGQSAGPEKRELEVQLPEGVKYQTGDYLVVLPLNHADTIERVVARFGLHADDLVHISGTRKAFLASKDPVPAAVFFSQRVELNTPPTQRQLEVLVAHTLDDKEKAAVQALASEDAFKTRVLRDGYSILDILEDHPSIGLPLSVYVDMLKPLTPRQYSISSSPLAAEHSPSPGHFTATITYDVHDAPARSSAHPGAKARGFHGVASSYLAHLKPGERIHCHVRRTNAAFHLPHDSAVPIIMIAAGTGIAPMRGFVQERAAIVAAGAHKVGPALLYFGCRDHEADYIYKEQLAQWEAVGAVEMRPAFSRRGPAGGESSFQYTHERMWAERAELSDLFDAGAKIFVCGSASKLARSTADVVKRILIDQVKAKKGRDVSAAEAEAWFERIREVRYVTDVFE